MCHLLKSEFKWGSTADETIRNVDLTGKVAIITGANAGMGFEVARVFVNHGATVIIGCRDITKAENAMKLLRESGAKGTVEAIRLDLASLASVRQFVEEFKAKYNTLNILVNNAGIMTPPARTETVDGFESQFGTNHLGHFLLFNLLVDELIRGAPARVVCVSSDSHSMSDIKYKDINFTKSYGKGLLAYGQSKTANILMANEITKRFADRGITANSLHPGVVKTDLLRNQRAFGAPIIKIGNFFNLFKTPPQGAATTVYVATAPELEGIGGKYFADSKEVLPSGHARDPKNAAKLWELSCKMVGLQSS